MLKRHRLNATKMLLTMLTLGMSIGSALAATPLQKSANSEITISANHMRSTSNGLDSLLNGNVRLQIGNRIKISADKVLVKYADGKIHKIAEFIIYGKGLLEKDNHSMQFQNGVFDPNTSQISAEQIQLVK